MTPSGSFLKQLDPQLTFESKAQNVIYGALDCDFLGLHFLIPTSGYKHETAEKETKERVGRYVVDALIRQDFKAVRKIEVICKELARRQKNWKKGNDYDHLLERLGFHLDSSTWGDANFVVDAIRMAQHPAWAAMLFFSRRCVRSVREYDARNELFLNFERITDQETLSPGEILSRIEILTGETPSTKEIQVRAKQLGIPLTEGKRGRKPSK